MEFPSLGKHCSLDDCKRLDFLPVKCDGCQQMFCKDHMKYTSHNCPTPRLIDYQVPVCPLCNEPVPSKRGEAPDIAVSAHIDRLCQSDPARARRLAFHKCSMKKCKRKEVTAIICRECGLNFCLTHRHADDHACKRNAPVTTTDNNKPAPKPAQDKPRRPPNNTAPNYSAIQGNMDEDEALAFALSLSMEQNQMPQSTHARNQPIVQLGSGRLAGRTASSNTSQSCNLS